MAGCDRGEWVNALASTVIRLKFWVSLEEGTMTCTRFSQSSVLIILV